MHDYFGYSVPFLIPALLDARSRGSMAKSHEEVIEGNLQQQLPGHDGEPLGHDVLPEELFEDGEGGLGHPPEAIADLPLPTEQYAPKTHDHEVTFNSVIIFSWGGC